MTYSGDRILLGSQRESQVSRFRPWVLFVIPLIAILFNFYIPLFFHFLGFLDLPLLVTVYFALMRRSISIILRAVSFRGFVSAANPPAPP